MKKFILLIICLLTGAGAVFGQDLTDQQKSIETITGRIGGNDYASKRAVEKLIKVGKPAVASLLKLAEDERPKARMWAVYGLCRIKAPQAKDAIIKCISDPDYMVRAVVGYQTANYGNPEVLKEVFNRLGIEKNGYVLAWMVRGMGEAGYKGALEKIQPLVGHKNDLLRTHAAGAVVRLDPQGFAPILSKQIAREKNPLVMMELTRLIKGSPDRRVEIIDNLVAGLVEKKLSLQVQVIGVLRGWTGESFGFNPKGTAEQRTQAVEKWKKWWVKARAQWKTKHGSVIKQPVVEPGTTTPGKK